MKETQEKWRIYEFGGFRLETADGKLFRGAEQVALTHKAVELLTLLVERRGETVSKNEILDALWRDTFIDENNLAVTVSMLRRAFGEKANDNRFIETVPKRGYRFVADVSETAQGNGALLVERRRQTRITISETQKLSNGWKWALASVALFLVFLGGLVYSFRTNPDGRNKFFALAPNASTRSIAVFPFNFQTSKIGAAKITGELNAALAEKLARIAEVAPAESFQTEQITNRNFLSVGEKLGVDALLLGNLFDHEEQIYFRLHLINVHDGEVLWAQTYREKRENLPALLEDLEQTVAQELAKINDPAIYLERARRYTANDQAYRLYLQGRTLWRLRGEIDETASAIDCFSRALELDPNFAPALIGLADLEKIASYDSPQRQRAEERINRALEIAPDLADAHATLGFIRMVHYWDWPAAESRFKEALRIDADCVNALQWYALLLALQMRHLEAEEKIVLARQAAPHSFMIRSDEAEIRLFGRNYAYALQLARALQRDVPNSNDRFLSDALWHSGDYADAARNFDERFGASVRPETFQQTFGQEGAGGVARLMVKRYMAEKKLDLWSSFWLAEWYAVLNEREKALDLLEQAVNEHHFFAIYIKASPFFDNLRGEPRFHALIKRVGLEN
jgi:DNA-binding winged helix-turn-helix (wHTH) protein/TolB-like protein